MGRDLINLDNVYANNLGMLEKICKTVNPSIEYPDNFFDELFPKDTKKDTFFAQLAYYSEIPVGACKAKLYPKKKGDAYPKGVHIEVLAVLDQYQNNQIETKFLTYIFEECKKHHQHNVYIHVPVNSNNILDWYKDNGFESEGEPLKELFNTTEGSADGIMLKKHVD
ncbi:similar to Saccharomyces cerevisiae YOR253W NAT5 Subunit of the N-terminal acetyltransferase NatA (Nat1p, Ard1p, Nat5p) [Maudiozyma barnettii]|uniref:Similar to Saccharomyces cerevisiae YOR253W NAT5 Subunit of the N-terminal acetyltransferase NatA (Nat1p, Ard1p, Nat5p) n=1 Tax=Maudiozyma barnettii TaxID=61262 RepID=A0A8H2VCV6_9SACH|nr:peptide alpha-N-acetyltransferase subunit NAT5 [Kazachstania barnettii]CAB4252893.1 similar to Saccharomyces cerevisiae YOR253W NAT5 Subunit of the N-terminal acetyltransferase NatA (Nat1p, Ard1p, Nat5p) [Kazachstania barnettii]CAD1780688.1 similar to Saccharomyces cerevisiae YOR253W NAT5 Subunit of the N-terminal acetyltransferase NatA (Nat1p, Ard1p, Nat5p) [Kazachstania barnettii]